MSCYFFAREPRAWRRFLLRLRPRLWAALRFALIFRPRSARSRLYFGRVFSLLFDRPAATANLGLGFSFREAAVYASRRPRQERIALVTARSNWRTTLVRVHAGRTT